jgi:hypothetical protein
MPNVVIIKGSPRYDEANADGAITPGHLVRRTSATQVGVHATADGVAEAQFALSDPSLSKSWDTAYASGERVAFAACKRGDQINALLATANNAVLNPPSPLVSNGDGTLKVASVGAGTLEGAVVAYARQALNNTSGSPQRLIVEVA